MIRTLLYVSTSRLSDADEDRDAAIQALVDAARTRNAALGVTGALIATQHGFSQILEGPAEAVESLMASITRDQRHKNIRVLMNSNGSKRRFPDWTIAYCGPASYVNRHIEPLMSSQTGPDTTEQVHKLVALMQAFTPDVAGGDTRYS